MSDIDRWKHHELDDQGNERPGWAAAVLSHLADAALYGYDDDRLTRAERDLLTAVGYRLRGRLGETLPDGESFGALGTDMIRSAAALIAAEGEVAS